MRDESRGAVRGQGRAKSLGARWDAARRVWYVENVDNLEQFCGGYRAQCRRWDGKNTNVAPDSWPMVFRHQVQVSCLGPLRKVPEDCYLLLGGPGWPLDVPETDFGNMAQSNDIYGAEHGHDVRPPTVAEATEWLKKMEHSPGIAGRV